MRKAESDLVGECCRISRYESLKKKKKKKKFTSYRFQLISSRGRELEIGPRSALCLNPGSDLIWSDLASCVYRDGLVLLSGVFELCSKAEHLHSGEFSPVKAQLYLLFTMCTRDVLRNACPQKWTSSEMLEWWLILTSFPFRVDIFMFIGLFCVQALEMFFLIFF